MARLAHPKKGENSLPATILEAQSAATAVAKSTFLQASVRVATVTAACQTSRTPRRTHYNWLRDRARAADSRSFLRRRDRRFLNIKLKTAPPEVSGLRATRYRHDATLAAFVPTTTP